MKKSIGKPYEGKLHVRFDEGGADSLIYYVIFGNMMEKKGYQALLYYAMLKRANAQIAHLVFANTQPNPEKTQRAIFKPTLLRTKCF